MGAFENIKKSAEQFKEAKWKTISDYEKEEAAKKAEKAYDKAGGPLVKKKCGGKVKKYARGGGCELRGKTKGRMV